MKVVTLCSSVDDSFDQAVEDVEGQSGEFVSEFKPSRDRLTTGYFHLTGSELVEIKPFTIGFRYEKSHLKLCKIIG